MIHFSAEEMRCRCGRMECDALTTPAKALLERLEVVRSEYNAPMVVTSGIRCNFWNTVNGGTPGSGHIRGFEVDIACPDSSARYEMLNAAFRVFTRIGIGRDFLHLGCDPTLPQRVVWEYYGKETR